MINSLVHYVSISITFPVNKDYVKSMHISLNSDLRFFGFIASRSMNRKRERAYFFHKIVAEFIISPGWSPVTEVISIYEWPQRLLGGNNRSHNFRKSAREE